MAETVREKLEAIQEFFGSRETAPPSIVRMRQLCTEALAALDQMEKDHQAMEKLRHGGRLGYPELMKEPTNEIWTYQPGHLEAWDSSYHDHEMGQEFQDPADAILGSKDDD